MKKIVIAADVLKQTLKKLKQAVGKNSPLPALSDLYCKVEAAEVQFITTDLELTIQCTCECMSTGAPFQMLIPFDYLQKIVSFWRNAPIELVLSSPTKLKINGEFDSYELNSLNKPDQYPGLPELPKKYSLDLNAEFFPWLKRSMESCSKDEARPGMMKTCIDLNATGFTMVSTDAHILFSRRFGLEFSVKEQLLISQKVAHALEGFVNAEVFWNEKHIAFSSGSVVVIATRHEDKFPDYKAIIPHYEPNLSLKRDDIVGALERMCLTSAENKLTSIRLGQTDGKIQFESNDVDLDRIIKVQIPGVYEGDADAVKVNAAKLLTMMNQAEFENIRLHIHEETKAILISSENDPDYLGLIMPLLQA